MEIEEYESFLEELSEMHINIGESVFCNLEKLLDAGNKKAIEAITFRAEYLTSYEENIVLAYFSTGHFTKYDDLERMGCFCVGLEADYCREILNKKKHCELYSENQILFKTIPSLFHYVRDRELIDYSVLQRINNSEIVSFNSYYSYINGCVPLQLLSWLSNNHPTIPLYIRLNPHAVFNIQPPQMICESQLIQPNPKWWHNLSIYNREKEGCSFLLNESCSPKENPEEYWDYHCRGIRRLDVIAKRNGNGNLSMMLEELTEHKKILSSKENYIVSRMIHLDTNASIGSPFGNANLNHLDLAINIYTNKNAINRWAENLANGDMVTNASFRTHLIRVENIPFSNIFIFAYNFFLSKLLVDEWKDTQFR